MRGDEAEDTAPSAPERAKGGDGRSPTGTGSATSPNAGSAPTAAGPSLAGVATPPEDAGSDAKKSGGAAAAGNGVGNATSNTSATEKRSNGGGAAHHGGGGGGGGGGGDSLSLFVGNLADECTDADLLAFFEDFPSCTHAVAVVDSARSRVTIKTAELRRPVMLTPFF